MDSRKRVFYVGLVAAVASLSVLFLTSSGLAAIESAAEDEGNIDGVYLREDLPYWDADRPKTGQASILALEISRQETYKEAKYGEFSWLDAAVGNEGRNTATEEAKIREFFSYTEDGNTDFKVTFPDGSEKFYRLYFMEVP